VVVVVSLACFALSGWEVRTDEAHSGVVQFEPHRGGSLVPHLSANAGLNNVNTDALDRVEVLLVDKNKDTAPNQLLRCHKRIPKGGCVGKKGDEGSQT
jgi:hypothetical protein